MKTRLLAGAVVAALFAVTANAQSDARPGTIADLTPPGVESFNPRALLTENFDNVSAATAPPAANGDCTVNMPGWVARNRSGALGTTCVFQGNPTVFSAQAGAANSYAAMNFNSTTGTNTISTWLLTPVVTFTANSALEFWVRGGTGNTFPDRLQVRVSTAGAGTDVGASATAVGTFTTLLLDINPTYAGDFACPAAGVTNVSTITGFPNAGWCRVRLTGAAGGLPTSGQGRIAFRYFVENGGPTGANSNFIGIDTFAFEDGVVVGPVTSTPVNTLSTYGLGLLGLLLAGVGIAAVRRYA
jgi:hypothetical protein